MPSRMTAAAPSARPPAALLLAAAVFLAALLPARAAWGQDPPVAQPAASPPDLLSAEPSPAEPSPSGVPPAGEPSAGGLPRGFRGIELGMELEAVKSLLARDPLFDYRGDADVSFLPVARQTLIECPGNAFVRRAYLQFEENRLFIIILDLDPRRLDYFSVFSTLSARYGDPGRISPAGAVWLSDQVRLSLERPLTVKYIDRPVFERLRDQGQARQKLKDTSRRQFLDQF